AQAAIVTLRDLTDDQATRLTVPGDGARLKQRSETGRAGLVHATGHPACRPWSRVLRKGASLRPLGRGHALPMHRSYLTSDTVKTQAGMRFGDTAVGTSEKTVAARQQTFHTCDARAAQPWAP